MACRDNAQIVIENITVKLNGKEVIKALSFEALSREITVIVGPNGSGKSTLLRAIIGELKVSSGDIRMSNQSIVTMMPRDRSKRVAMLPQFSTLNFPYRVRDVVSLGRVPHASGAVTNDNIIDSALEAMDLTDLQHQLYPRLSGGEKQRTQLARVMAQIWPHDDTMPRVLLLDEPLNSLDLGHQQKFLQSLRTFANSGLAVIMVLHDLNFAIQYGQKVLAVSRDQEYLFGACESVLTNDYVNRLFGVSTNMVKDPSSGKKMLVCT